MSNVHMVKLGDLCDIVIGRTPARKEQKFWDGDIPWLSITDMNQGTLITRTKEKITEAGARNGKLVPPGTVLFSFKLSIGKVGIAKIPLYTNEAIVSLPIKDTSIILPEYLMRFLEACNFDLQGNRAAMGKTLNKKSLHEIEISVPSIRQQLEIVTILSKVKKIQEARERQLAALDELEYAIYNEIFADFPLEATLEDLGIDFVSGKNLVGTGENIHQHNRVLKVSAVSHGYFKSQEVKPLPADYSPPSSHLVHKGDILFSRASGSLQLVGITCPVTYDLEDTYLPDKIWRVEATDPTKIDVRFIHYLLKSHAARAYIENMASGAAGVKNISKQKMKSLPCPVVPMEVQQIFLEKTIDINYLRSRIKESLRLSKNTAKNLLHEYIQRR